MARPPTPSTATDNEIRALLERYACLVPFHEVRTRFLGNIAAPGPQAAPIKAVQGLWGGELPELESMDAVNELLGALVMGLWNRLSRHQERNNPFRLTRFEVQPTREGLHALAQMRVQELDGFFEGLFGTEEELDFPPRAHSGLGALSALRAQFAAVQDVAMDESAPGSREEMQTTVALMRRMTKDAEHEIHAVLISCKLARRQILEALPSRKPTLH